jgi:hypothetical protein
MLEQSGVWDAISFMFPTYSDDIYEEIVEAIQDPGTSTSYGRFPLDSQLSYLISF